MSARLYGKRALITGGARGIGFATVREFTAQGAQVLFCDLDADSIANACAELGPDASAVVADVSDSAAVAALYTTVDATLGGLDIVVNNAGTAISGGLEEISEADWDRQFAVNVKSVYLVSRPALPRMRAAGGGSIINIASESAFIGFPMHPAYCASKAAVLHLSRSMAVRYAADRIRVNALCPGSIETPLFKHFLAQQADPEATRAEIERLHPLGFGTPEDIAHAAVFLASDESRYATGAAFLIDGGATAI